MNNKLEKYLSSCRAPLEKRLEYLVSPPYFKASTLQKAMHYSLMAGGKRLRPILCIASAEAILKDHEKAVELCLDVACALEMIHGYSLIHDDLPAMDNDDLRRGLPSCHKAFDEATAILAGDALQALAFEVLALSSISRLKPELGLKLTALISSAAGGSLGMVAGQMLDLESEAKRLDIDSLEKLHRLKTGAIIKASLISGALIAEADEKEKKALSDFGEALGLAFQITDDLLDIKGDTKVMGKAKGSDLKSLKSTYPLLLGFEEAEVKAKEAIETALDSLSIFTSEAEPLRAIAEHILNRKK